MSFYFLRQIEKPLSIVKEKHWCKTLLAPSSVYKFILLVLYIINQLKTSVCFISKCALETFKNETCVFFVIKESR